MKFVCPGGGMADTQVSKTCDRKVMRVRLSPRAHNQSDPSYDGSLWFHERESKTAVPPKAGRGAACENPPSGGLLVGDSLPGHQTGKVKFRWSIDALPFNV